MSDLPKPVEPILAYLTVSDAAAAIRYYEKAFGAQCTFQMPEDDGDRIMHATLRIGDHGLYLSDEFAEFGGTPSPNKEYGSPVGMSLAYASAAEVDAVHNNAVKEGAEVLSPLEDMFWGDRFSQIVDPFGHRWMLRGPLKQEG